MELGLPLVGQADLFVQKINERGMEDPGQQCDRDRATDDDDRQRPLFILLSIKMQRQFNPELLGGVAPQHARHHDVIDVGAR
jgi:hypothetical protein